MITDPQITQGVSGTTFLGKSGLRVSRICFGAMTFGAQANLLESHAMLDYAFEKGIFFFDTANVYSGGEAERILGKWIKDKRDAVVVASKVRYQVGANLMSVGLSRRTIRTEVESSLKRLQTEYIDVLYLHQPDYQTDISETLDICNDLIREGKVHVLGVSNFAAWQLMQAYWQADTRGLTPPYVVQPMYNLIARGIEQELLPCCKALQVATFVYNPLAAGLLTGKHSLEKGIEKGGRFEVLPYYQDRYWNEQAFAAVNKLQEIAQNAGRSLISLSLQWLLDNPSITGIILGARNLQQLTENIESFGDPLSPEIRQACDAVWSGLRGVAPLYNR